MAYGTTSIGSSPYGSGNFFPTTAIRVTSANTNTVQKGARIVVRNSSGTPYIVLQDRNDSGIEVWKGNATDPTSFSEQDTANNPQAGTDLYGSPAAAIDSTDIIHIVYQYYNTKTSELRYVTFNADGLTDTFSGDVQIIADIGDDPTNILNLYTGIAVDSNEIPHLVYTEVIVGKGTSYFGVFYNNRIGGSWNASGIEIEGASSSQRCYQPDIAIDSDNKPCVSYWNGTEGSYGAAKAAIGDANDAASFTLFTIASADGGYVIDHRYTGIAVDSNGDHHVAYTKIATAGIADSLEIRKHVKANAWSSWETVEVVDASSGLEPFYVTLAINGTDRYIFCGELTTDNVVYYIDTGSGWGFQQPLETGTYKAVRVKWAYNVNRGSDGTDYGGGSGIPEIDYVFEDSTATPDIFWNKVVLVVAPTNINITDGLSASENVQKSILANIIDSLKAKDSLTITVDIPIVDLLQAAEIFTVNANVSLLEVVKALDTLSMNIDISTTDGLIASENVQKSPLINIVDSLKATDSLIITVNIPVVDLLQAAETFTVNANVSLLDILQAAEALQINSDILTTDKLRGKEIVVPAVLVNTTDFIEAEESSSISAIISLLEVAKALDTLNINSDISAIDRLITSEKVQISTIIDMVDSLKATDSLTITIDIPIVDLAAALEIVQVGADISIVDLAAALEIIQAKAGISITDRMEDKESVLVFIPIDIIDRAESKEAHTVNIDVSIQENASGDDIIQLALGINITDTLTAEDIVEGLYQVIRDIYISRGKTNFYESQEKTSFYLSLGKTNFYESQEKTSFYLSPRKTSLYEFGEKTIFYLSPRKITFYESEEKKNFYESLGKTNFYESPEKINIYESPGKTNFHVSEKL